MQRRHLFAAAGALALSLTGTMAIAQPRGRDDDRDGHPGRGKGHDKHDGRHDGRHDDRGPHGRDDRDHRDDRRGPDRHAHNRDRGPGAGPDRRFYRGDRLPPDFRRRQYVVENWRGYRLSPPPRGYHWVQLGADFVLVAIASGVIMQIILNH